MQLRHVGYFPKRTASPERWDPPAHVTELCSVSTCLAHAPDDWIEHWRHNELGLFNTIADAESVIPSRSPGFSVFAYSLLSEAFSQGAPRPVALPPEPPEPIPPHFVSLGFDSVSKSISAHFECSPLSCNGEFSRFPLNEFCLFPSLEAAIAAAQVWSVEQPEPGDYFVLEVFRSKSTAGA